MTAMTYAPATLDVARERLAKLFTAFAAHTGASRSAVGRIAGSDGNFGLRFRHADFGHATFDRAVGRLSAIWPEDLPWPEDVPRLAPCDVPPSVEQYVRRLASKPPVF